MSHLTHASDRPHIGVLTQHRSPIPWLALGMISAVRISIGADIYVGELLAVIAVVAMFLSRLEKESVRFLLLALLWSFAQLGSDLYHGTEPWVSAKGVSAPLVFACTVVALCSMPWNNKRISYFLAGTLLVAGVDLFLRPSAYALENVWKWGGGAVVLGWLMVGGSFKTGSPRIWLLACGFGCFAAVSLLNDARSLAFVPLAGFSLWAMSRAKLISSWATRYFSGRLVGIKVAAVFGLLLLAGSFLMNQAVQLRFINESVSEALIDKYRAQGESDLGLLLAGRSELIISLRAFADSPVLGHGSWAEDRRGYTAEYVYLRWVSGVTDNPNELLDSRYIPAHSFLFGALVWSGLAGGIFWIYVINLISVRYITHFAVLPVYFHVGFLSVYWAILFSPFGAENRFACAVIIGLLLGFIRRLPLTRRLL